MALSVDVNGIARPFNPGEKFAGFAVEARMPDAAALSVLSSFEGVIEMHVEGATPGSVGESVFATGPFAFTLNSKAPKAVKIGHVIKGDRNGRTLIKYAI